MTSDMLDSAGWTYTAAFQKGIKKHKDHKRLRITCSFCLRVQIMPYF